MSVPVCVLEPPQKHNPKTLETYRTHLIKHLHLDLVASLKRCIHHHLPVAYAVGVPTDLHKLLNSWRSWAEEIRECTSIWVHSLMLDNQDFLGLPLFLPPSTIP